MLERSGVKRVIHGPFTFAPDGNPLIGPVPGLRNYWSACAVMAGFSQGGGMGLSLAQWMIHGEVERDPRGFDVARFGTWTTPGYTVPKVIENYQTRFCVGLSERGTARRPPLPHHADVRHLQRHERRLGPAIRAGGGELPRPAGRAAATRRRPSSARTPGRRRGRK